MKVKKKKIIITPHEAIIKRQEQRNEETIQTEYKEEIIRSKDKERVKENKNYSIKNNSLYSM